MLIVVWLILILGGAITTIVSWAIYGTSVGAPVLIGYCLSIWAVSAAVDWIWGLRRKVAKHMKKKVSSTTFISKEIGESRRVDYARVLESIAKKQQANPMGMELKVNLNTLKHSNIQRGSITWNSVEAEDGKVVNVPENAVYLLNCNGSPFVAHIGSAKVGFDYEHEGVVTTGKGSELQLCAHNLEQANVVLQWLKSQTSEHSVYREKMLLVASPQDGSTGQTIRITHRPEQSSQRIIIPERISQLVDRLIRSRLNHRERLEKYGHNSKIGLLFHGPPGTGKTLFIRHLIANCKQHTVIAPTDMAVETLREAFRLAQYLQPSIMVLEDVDLLAQHRESSRSVDGLQELMNQLDGLAPASETIIVMSTNRPEVLEPALASRPGRVSQAIEFPLPDPSAREALLRLFLDKVKTGFDFSAWTSRTDGACPAFIEELCKRAILVAIDEQAGGTSSEAQVEINDAHLDTAIHELIVFGGDLTASSLGFPNTEN